MKNKLMSAMAIAMSLMMVMPGMTVHASEDGFSGANATAEDFAKGCPVCGCTNCICGSSSSSSDSGSSGGSSSNDSYDSGSSYDGGGSYDSGDSGASYESNDDGSTSISYESESGEAVSGAVAPTNKGVTTAPNGEKVRCVYSEERTVWTLWHCGQEKVALRVEGPEGKPAPIQTAAFVTDDKDGRVYLDIITEDNVSNAEGTVKGKIALGTRVWKGEKAALARYGVAAIRVNGMVTDEIAAPEAPAAAKAAAK